MTSHDCRQCGALIWFAALSFILWLTLFSGPSSAARLVVGISDSLSAPLVMRSGSTVSGGILKDVCDELGRRLNLNVEYIPLPRKRHLPSLKSGQIHLLPYATPEWLGTPENIRWSPPWLVERELFVLSAANDFPIQSFDDLLGKHLGTINGYRYPGLELWLEQRWILRADGHTLEQNFKRLAAGRIDALIGKQLTIDYYLKQHPDPQQFRVTQLTASEANIQIALSPQLPVSIESLNHRLQQMVDEGLMAEILTRYQ